MVGRGQPQRTQEMQVTEEPHSPLQRHWCKGALQRGPECLTQQRKLDSGPIAIQRSGNVGAGAGEDAGESSIREVIAFPRNNKACDLMTDSPTKVDFKQLRELSIQSTAKEKKTEAPPAPAQ